MEGCVRYNVVGVKEKGHHVVNVLAASSELSIVEVKVSVNHFDVPVNFHRVMWKLTHVCSKSFIRGSVVESGKSHHRFVQERC